LLLLHSDNDDIQQQQQAKWLTIRNGKWFPFQAFCKEGNDIEKENVRRMLQSWTQRTLANGFSNVVQRIHEIPFFGASEKASNAWPSHSLTGRAYQLEARNQRRAAHKFVQTQLERWNIAAACLFGLTGFSKCYRIVEELCTEEEEEEEEEEEDEEEAADCKLSPVCCCWLLLAAGVMI